jgi:hypothetical protein
LFLSGPPNHAPAQARDALGGGPGVATPGVASPLLAPNGPQPTKAGISGRQGSGTDP